MELPENYALVYCTACGRDITMEQIPTVASPKTDWPVFFAVLLAPAILSFVGIALDLGAVMVIATFGGSLVAGKMCSSLLAERREMSAAIQWLAAGAFAVLSFILCFGGCIAGSVIVRH
jgi:hypothetical protein